MIKIAILLVGLLLTSSKVSAQSLPCVPNSGFWAFTSSTAQLSICAPDGLSFNVSGLSNMPSGAIILSLTTCGTGFTEVTALNGVTLVGTIAANGNVGTSGGSNNITPTGTITAPTFTGSALAAHAHELPFQMPSTTTTRQIATNVFGVGTNRTATGVSAAGAGNTNLAAVVLSEAKSAGTPAGTISAPSFSGVQFDNRSAFKFVIFCQKS